MITNGEAEKSLWAHSIIGAFDKNAFVCEGYAKLLEILLNYRGVENYIVTGLAGSGSSRGGHAWNLVRLDDGNWYWFDGTWGDAEPTNYTLYARYFCALDSVLLSTHSPYSTEASAGGTVVPSLPKRSQGAYKNSSVIALGDSFSVNGCTYKRVSYDEVECILGSSDSTVEYLGQKYSVIKK